MNEPSEGIEFAEEEGDQPLQGATATSREVISTPYDASVRTLVDDIQRKELIVNPDFQRGTVWPRKLKSRLIESLLLNIPIPVLYFAEDDDGTRVVIDGQQRLRAISEFHAGTFALSDLQVLPALNGKRWTDLSPRDARTITNRTLRCVVISAKSSATLRFEMFERLNTGFVHLNDQELRNCIYRGPFNDLLESIATNPDWLAAMNKERPNPRLTDHELVLRFLALNSAIEDYRPPLKQLLNTFMESHRRALPEQLNGFSELVIRAARNSRAAFGENIFRRVRGVNDDRLMWDTAMNRAVFDIQMLAFAEAPEGLIAENSEVIQETFQDLCLNDEIFADAISLATADRTRFYTRLRRWGELLQSRGVQVAYLARLPAVV